MHGWRLSLAGGLATGLLLAALFPPLNLTFLAPVALTPLLYALAKDDDWRSRLAGGWLGGFVYWMLVCYWIRDTLALYGGLNGPLSWLAETLFAAAKGLHLAVFALLAGWLMRRKWAIPAVAALWTGVERTHGPLGFTWLLLGNAGIDMGAPLRLAPWVGVYGLSFVFAALAAGVALALLRRPRMELAWLAALAGLLLLPPVVLKKAPDRQAAALQTVVYDDHPWSFEEKEHTVGRLAQLSLAEALDPSKPKPSFVVWPEAPAPFYYYRDPDFREAMTDLARVSEVPLLFGGVAYTPEGAPLNSAFFLDAKGRFAGRYDKRFLVPFGEFVPPGFGWIQKVSSEAGNYAAGTRAELFAVGQHAVGPLICYEAAFPHLVRDATAAGPDLLVNLTNDGYFGQSAARPQHLLLARMRAVENRRWFLRVTNDGISCSIDPAGQVWDRQPERQRLTARLRFSWIHERTFYTEHGDWFAWGCLLVGLALCGWEVRRGSH